MGRYLDLIRDTADTVESVAQTYDQNDKNDQSGKCKGHLSFRSFLSYHEADALSAGAEAKSGGPKPLVPGPSAPADPDFWCDLFAERTAARQFGGGYTGVEAKRLAWGELQNRWHMAHGAHVPPHLCAGCDRPIATGQALDLIDGCRVHLANGSVDCLVKLGRVLARRRHASASNDGLAAAGFRGCAVTCLWCGLSFRVRRRGGSPQKFCCAAHRAAFHSAARRWAERAISLRLSRIDDLKADPAACTLLLATVSPATEPEEVMPK